MAGTAVPPREARAQDAGVSSFSKALMLGEIHEQLVFPYPIQRGDEVAKVRALVQSFRAFAAENIDSRRIDEERWIPDEIYRQLGELGLMGLYVPEEYGGQGLSQVGYARVFEAIGQVDGSLTIGMGVHQSIGFKAIVMFGSDEQKARFLPDLAAGRKLAGFALTEPNAGSDAYNIESRAVRQGDGSWLLNGEKMFIGNGGRGHVFTVFARTEIDGKDRHTAFIVERGMAGFESGEPYDTMGLRGNNLTPLYFNDVRIPAENVIGEPGEGWAIATAVLNNGRLGLGTGTVGLAKRLIDLAIEHVKERHQFGRPLADFELVEEKIAWMVSYLFGFESMAYLTCGLVDVGVPDYSLESAMAKIAGTEFVWYQANRAMQLKGGRGYLRTEPYELIMRDIRIFPIFEGANDVLRSYVALGALKPLGQELGALTDLDLGDPIRSLGVLADYVVGRISREIRPDAITLAAPQLADDAKRVSELVKRLRDSGEALLRKHGKGIIDQGLAHKRLAEALMDVYAQIAVLSRVTAIFAEQGADASGQERYIASTFCERAARRANGSLDQLERNDDDRMHSIARLAYKRGAYGYALFED
jgi:acyl-CoA dehydrogenase family protein 9